MNARLLLFACLLGTGCASPAPDHSPARALAAAESPQERLAEALVAADRAAREGDSADLADALADIAALRARPLDPVDETQLATWHRQSGARAIPFRGRTLGRGYRSGTVTPGGNVVIEQTFLSGRRASIALSVAEGRVLGFSVLDGSERSVCREEARRSTCTWVPLFTQRHTIRISNPGRDEARYYLVVD